MDINRRIRLINCISNKAHLGISLKKTLDFFCGKLFTFVFVQKWSC